VDAVITDPPYEIPKGSNFWRKHGNSLEDWGDEIQNAVAGEWLPSVPFAEGAYCLEFGRNHPEAVEAIVARHRACGLTPWHFVEIVKKNPPPTPRPKFVDGYEQALVSHYGKRRWFGGGYVVDRYIVNVPEAGVERVHPTQKPVGAFLDWLPALTDVSALILDPFMGSGTTLVAAELLGRRGIGIEISEEYFNVACRRVEEAVKKREAAEAQLTLTEVPQ
jgi:DNA modification methylase